MQLPLKCLMSSNNWREDMMNSFHCKLSINWMPKITVKKNVEHAHQKPKQSQMLKIINHKIFHFYGQILSKCSFFNVCLNIMELSCNKNTFFQFNNFHTILALQFKHNGLPFKVYSCCNCM